MNNLFIQVPTFISHFFQTTTTSYFFFWTVLGLFLLMFELGHPGLFLFVSFFLGALSAAGVGLYGLSFLMQCVFFLLGSLVAFLFLRRWLVHEQKHGHRSNVYALQGKEAVIVTAIAQNDFGHVKVNGELWRAQATTQDPIPIATRVRVVAIRGTRLIVEKV